MDWGGWKRFPLAVIGAAVALAVFAALYGWLPWWIDGARLRHLSTMNQVGLLSSDRGDVLKMFAGTGALVALVYTARKHSLDRQAHNLDRQAQELSRQVYMLSEQGQVTDRYTKAITQLASEKLSERIGGIYALERVMADSVRDHPTVVEVLAAFVRQRAPVPDAPDGGGANGGGANGGGENTSSAAVKERPDADVQAAITVLARRPKREELFALDLRRTVLVGLELPWGARLERVNFAGALLAKAQLVRAVLTGADLSGATLTEANLRQATLTGADLSGATLTKANLRQAVLTGATLSKATLSEADLIGATVAGTKGLVASQLADVGLTEATKLDVLLAHNVWVRARLNACKGWPGFGPVPARTPEPLRPAP